MNPKQIIYLIIAFIALALAGLGVVLPILPTVPFLLVAAFCFSRSSEKFDNWFKSTKIYQDNLADYVKGEGMTKKAKIRVMLTLSLVFAFAFFMMRRLVFGRSIIFVVWLAHIVYFTFFVEVKPEEE